MSDITGYNRLVAFDQIKRTIFAIDRTIVSYYDANKDFWDELYLKWASPKAVEFSNKYQPIIYNELLDFFKMERAFIIDAVDACKKIAEANGDTSFSVNNFPLIDIALESKHIGGDFPTFREDFFGTVGMNVMKVKEIIAKYIADTSEAVASLSDIPFDIALFDPDNAMANAYKNQIEKMKEKMEATITMIKSDISKAMGEEENTILIAKDSATEALNG